MVLLFTKYEIHPKVMRKTLALLFLSFSTFSLPIFLIKNAISMREVSTGFIAVPLVIMGGYLGDKISGRVSGRLFRLATIVLVFASSVQIILKTLKII